MLNDFVQQCRNLGYDCSPYESMDYGYEQSMGIFLALQEGYKIPEPPKPNATRTEILCDAICNTYNLDRNKYGDDDALAYQYFRCEIYTASIEELQKLGLTSFELEELADAYENKVDPMPYLEKGYSSYQIAVLVEAFEQDILLDSYVTPEYDPEQMEEVMYGLIDDIDVSPYLDPDLSVSEMSEIREELTYASI